MSHPQTTSTGQISRRSLLGGGAALAVGLLAGCNSPGGSGSTNGTLNVLAFAPPSLGAFLPAVISAQGIDKDHKLPMKFSYTTPDNYNTEFSSGHYAVGGSAALLSEALRTERKVGVTYLFNLFDYFTAIVTTDGSVKSLKDLEGKRLAAATGTTNHAMFEWFAEQGGLDLSKVELMNQTPAGLSTMALTGKTDATEIWEPAYTSLISKKPDIRSIDIGLSQWQSAFGTDVIPYLGLAAKSAWAKDNPDKVKKLYAVYRDAAQWTTDQPSKSAAIIAKAMPKGDAKTMQGLIEDNERLKLHVTPAESIADEIAAVFKAGNATGYLKKTPPSSIVYKGIA